MRLWYALAPVYDGWEIVEVNVEAEHNVRVGVPLARVRIVGRGADRDAAEAMVELANAAVKAGL